MVRAEKLTSTRVRLGDDAFADLVIWRVPTPVRGSSHFFKYRLALVVGQVCVLRYDNEAGKGDHRHAGNEEHPYEFTDIHQLRRDFLLEARRWLKGHRGD